MDLKIVKQFGSLLGESAYWETNDNLSEWEYIYINKMK